MGYDIKQTGSKFLLKREHHGAALEALRQLWYGSAQMTGRSSDGARWFAFCNGARPKEWTNLEQALLEMRWRAKTNLNGDIVNLQFMGQKRGDDDKILTAISAYVEPGSFIAMEGEDGYRWRWVFNGHECVQWT